MDATDVKILDCLRSNARMAASAVGEQVNLSVSAVLERIRKLETQGVIKQYTVLLDAKKINKDLTAFISVSLEHPKYNDGFVECIAQDKRLTECHYITGDFDFLLKVVTDSTQSLEAVLNTIKSIKGVSLTKTLVVLSTLKQDVSVLPETV
ncbi:MAG: Lrp/AsnC family transcriptional regulator [Clostridiaceae bacterium]|nr:Lrp/AsnC family transcriptional regulator [Eubacteriales bacterium]NLV47366.1 Lrp/AsnC family transcriptional regulator [Clostridiaceae bacterium]